MHRSIKIFAQIRSFYSLVILSSVLSTLRVIEWCRISIVCGSTVFEVSIITSISGVAPAFLDVHDFGEDLLKQVMTMERDRCLERLAGEANRDGGAADVARRFHRIEHLFYELFDRQRLQSHHYSTLEVCICEILQLFVLENESDWDSIMVLFSVEGIV